MRRAFDAFEPEERKMMDCDHAEVSFVTRSDALVDVEVEVLAR
jgi:hypothetical protein